MKLSHYLARKLQDLGVTYVFGVQGGAVVHLFDSLHTQTSIKVCYTHHEQSAALAAVAHAKKTGSLGVCITTTGPAATNALTGLLASWQDSVPVLFISGQTRSSQTSYGLNIRQRGSQECNILDVVKPWTKYSTFIDGPSTLPSALAKACEISLEGRPGPVWLDLPVDLQWLDINVSSDYSSSLSTYRRSDDINIFRPVIDNIISAKRPIFVMGRMKYNEVLLSKFLSTIMELNIPIASTWGSSTIARGCATSSGIIGASGQPSANYSIRAADCVIFLGCHFSITQSGSNYQSLSNRQEFIFINIDDNELNLLASAYASTVVKANVNEFLEYFSGCLRDFDFSLNANYRTKWRDHISIISQSLSPMNAVQLLSKQSQLNPHYFICSLYNELSERDLVVIDGGGCALYAGFQCIPPDASFTVICSTSISAMGTGLPELCGAAISKPLGSLNVCIIGDGSLMFNIQELQTIKTNLDSSIVIVLNNSGYLAIRHTQKQFLDKKFFGTSSSHGIEIPSIQSIANAFSFEYKALDCNEKIDDLVDYIVSNRKRNNHLIIELIVSPEHHNLFTASFIKNSEKDDFTQQDLHLMEPFSRFKFEFSRS